MLELISSKLPDNKPHAQALGLIEKCQHVLGWLQQFVKGVHGRPCGKHGACSLSAGKPFWLERGCPKKVGPQEIDNLCISLLGLLAMVIGDINLCESSALINQPGVERPSLLWPGASLTGEGWSAPAAMTSQSLVVQTSSTGLGV